MDDQKQLKKVEEFIKSHNLAVLATVDRNGLPQAAVIGYSENGFEIFFGTYESSRKYSNLKTNAHVALVIGWDKGTTLQLSGDAEELAEAEIEEMKSVHLAKMPSAAKYVDAKEEKFFKIKPKWIRYSDLSVDPWNVFEIRF